MPLHSKADSAGDLDLNPMYVREEGQSIPRNEIPARGMLPDTALQVVRDELILDGNARLNLATFVTTWMEPQARQLMAECFDKNMIDKDEYPQTAELERRCVNILASLWHAPDATASSTDGAVGAAAAAPSVGNGAPSVGNAGPSVGATGCSTTGSSEACMLGGMALLWRWRGRHSGAGAAAGPPNLVMGSNVQVCWEKFCRYWQVEPRLVPMAPGRLHLTGAEAAARCDENTIGVVAVMGSTMDGSYEPVHEIGQCLDQLHADTGLDVPVHVDGASGGFVAPFLQPDIEWDFRVRRVVSINASGHKYGLVYPGVGWVVWRDAAALPEDLIFRVNYLGGDMPTFALNFSRPGGHVAAQYYNFLRLGFEGFRRVQQACQDVAMHLSAEIAQIGPFELLTDGSELPVFAFRLRDEHAARYSVFDLSERLRQRGWRVPAYTFPADMRDTAVLRIVVRNGFSMDMAGLLLDDLRQHTQELAAQPCPPAAPVPGGRQRQRRAFAH